MPGFYLPELTNSDKQIQLTGTEFHHLAHVRRLHTGDKVTLTNGNGLLAQAEIKHIQPRSADLEIIELVEIKRSAPEIAVAFSLLKSKHDQLIIEKLTELGIGEFFPLTTKRSVKKAARNTIRKFRSTAIAAIKQCDNAYLPTIHAANELATALDKIVESGYKPVVALESGKRISVIQALSQLGEGRPCLIIGPEGGFSPHEIEFLAKQEIAGVTLGNHILRAETAAIAGAAQMISFYLGIDPEYY